MNAIQRAEVATEILALIQRRQGEKPNDQEAAEILMAAAVTAIGMPYVRSLTSAL